MIRVCTQFDEPFRGVADLTLPVLREYCERHGYSLRVDENAPIKRSIVWDRFSVVAEELRQEWDWIVHVDADVLITNFHIRLEEFMEPGTGIVISACERESGGRFLNDGVCLFENCMAVLNIVDRVVATEEGDRIFCGQDVLQQILDGRMGAGSSWIKVERQKAINAFLYEEYGMPKTTIGQWTPGDFVLHLPGCSNQRRIEIFSEKLKEVIR
jgi:hypothetical protein